MRAVIARVLISALPLLLVGLTAASLLSVKQARARSSNQLVIAVAGEPETLNPLLFTTQIANRIGLLLFDGLLRLDENLELAPGLAESWTQTQTTTMFFRSPDAAARAARSVETLRSRWDGWALLRVEPIETELRLFFSRPGTRSSAEIFTLLDPSEIERLSLLRLQPAPGDAVIGSSLVKRSWRDGARAIELTIAATPAHAMRELERLAGERIAHTATPVGELPYLDEPEIVFRLRPDVTWHDGTKFSAEDVAFTYRAIVDDSIGSPRRADYQLVQTVDIPDPRTVRIIYRKPYSFALNSWTIGILPQHLLAGRPPAWWIAHFNRQPIGTGAFRFEKWQTNEEVTLVKNPEHFRGAPHLDRIAFRIIPDRVSAGIAFQTEQIDIRDLDPYAAARLEKKAEVDVLSAPALEYHFIGWNLRRTALRDKRVRQALAHAIDVEAILRDVIYGRGVRATGPYVPGMFFFNENVAPIPFDPDRAKLLLGEAGWKRGADGILVKEGERFHLELVTNNDNPVRKDIATLAQRYLRQVGIEVEVRAHEWATFISQVVLTRTFDGVVLSWALRNDPDQYQIWHSSQTGPRQLNIAGYEDGAVDALLEQLRVEYEQPRIKLLAGELQKKIYEDQPYTFLHVPLQSVALQPDRFRLRVPGNGQWQERPVVMSKAGLQPEWFCRVLR